MEGAARSDRSYPGLKFMHKVYKHKINSDNMKATLCAILFAFIGVVLLASTSVAATNNCATSSATKNIILGNNIVSPQGFNRELDNKDLSTLKASSLNFQGQQYNYREVIAFHNQAGGITNAGPQVSTSLTEIGGTQDDYKDGVYLETPKGANGFYVVFDAPPINISKATKAEPLSLNILGKRIDILSVANEKSFTARIWDEKERKLFIGDSIFIDKKSISLKDVDQKANTIKVSVSGVTKTITVFDTVNGVDIGVAESHYSNKKSEQYAILVAGKNNIKDISDGDGFAIPCASKYKRAECKEDNPDWVWDVDDLTAKANGNTITVAGIEAAPHPTIGVINDYIVNDFNDNPPTADGEYDFPNGGKKYRILFGSLSTVDYLTLSATFKSAEDFSAVFPAQNAEPAFLIEASEDYSLDVFTGNNYKRTNKIWLSYNDAQPDKNIDVFYFDGKTSSIKLARTVDQADAQNQISKIGRISYRATLGKDTLTLLLKGKPGYSDELRLVLDVNADGIASPQDYLEVWLGTLNNEFASLGQHPDRIKPRVMIYNHPTLVSKGWTFQMEGIPEDKKGLHSLKVYKDGQLGLTLGTYGAKTYTWAETDVVKDMNSGVCSLGWLPGLPAGTYNICYHNYTYEAIDTDGNSASATVYIPIVDYNIAVIYGAPPVYSPNYDSFNINPDVPALIWKGGSGGDVWLGTKDENHRTKYGIVIENPLDNGAQERVQLKIPSRQIKARITVSGLAC